MSNPDPQELRPRLYKLLHKYFKGEQWYDGEIDQTLEAIEALFTQAQQSLLRELVDDAMENEEVTYGGMGSDIPCIPIEVIQKRSEEMQIDFRAKIKPSESKPKANKEEQV